MQYKGVYACGHEGTVKISGGKAADREWKANRAFEHDCPECQKKAREEEIRVINEESASDSKKLRFPELEGSPKQIAWANTIRLKFYDFCVERGISPDEVIDNETSASWWIDTHTCDEQFIAEYGKEPEQEPCREITYDADDDIFTLKLLDGDKQNEKFMKSLEKIENVNWVSDTGITIQTKKILKVKRLVYRYCFVIDKNTADRLEIDKAEYDEGLKRAIEDQKILKRIDGGN